MVAVVGMLLALALVVPVSAQVDCSNPDNLCTGDPCVIPALEAGPNCVDDPGGGGTIRGVAGGNVTVTGRYQAAPNGEICFSAGGTLDTSGATFDGPVTSCPP